MVPKSETCTISHHAKPEARTKAPNRSSASTTSARSRSDDNLPARAEGEEVAPNRGAQAPYANAYARPPCEFIATSLPLGMA